MEKLPMIEKREIIVAGAGPAGAITAILLAEMKHDVLLLDKSDFPREKICGDAVSAPVFELLNDIGLGEKIRAALANGSFYPLSCMRLISPHGYQQTYPLNKSNNDFSAAVAPRIHFDTMIQQQAIKAGAEFRQARVEGPLIEQNRVVGVRIGDDQGSKSVIKSAVVVGADGVASNLARVLRQGKRQSKKHRALALRAYAADIEIYPHEVEFYIYKNILPGYAWIFPLGDKKANIGLGMRLDHYRRQPRNLKIMLNHFLELPLIKKRLHNNFKLQEIAAWPLSFGSELNIPYAFEGALLVGDAGGFISPLTGGGIHRSLLSGKLAAEVLHGALTKGDFSLKTLAYYETLCKTKLLKSLRQTYHLANLLLQFPFLVDLFVSSSQRDNPLTRIFAKKL
jgi:menaquinone-9 beta-reductase